MKLGPLVKAFLFGFSSLVFVLAAAAEDLPPAAPVDTPVLSSSPSTREDPTIETPVPTATPTRSPAEDWRYSQEISAFMSDTQMINAKRREAMFKAWKARGSLFADLIMSPKARLSLLDHLGVKKWFPAYRSVTTSSPSSGWEFIQVKVPDIGKKRSGLSLRLLIANPEFASIYAAGLVKEATSAKPPGLVVQKEEPITLPQNVKAILYTLPNSSLELYVQLPQWSFLELTADPGTSREELLDLANKMLIPELVQYLWPKR